MPQLATLPPPYALALIEASSLPAQRKKKMTELLQGGGEQSPEAQAMAQKQAEMAERAAMAEISTKESSAALNMAKAQNEGALRAAGQVLLRRPRARPRTGAGAAVTPARGRHWGFRGGCGLPRGRG